MISTQRLLIAGALSALVLVPIAAQSLTATEAAQGDVITRGGVVRIGPKTYLHENTSHASIGITSVRVIHCELVVRVDIAPDEKIVAAIATEDETMSRLDVQAGLSGGGPVSNISFWRKGKKVCATSKIFGTTSNVWLSFTYLKGNA